MKRERLAQIYDYIENHENVSTLELTAAFQVSEMTIRRDLAALEKQGKISRFHGGASVRQSEKSEAAFELRIGVNYECKAAIGRHGVEYLQTHICSNHPNSIFLGSGSTIYCMAKQMSPGLSVPIITDNLYISTILAASDKNTVIMVGGQLILPSLNATGYIAEKMISDFTIDCAFISSSALDENGNLYAYNLLEAGVFSTVISSSKHVVVLADHTKLGKKNLVHVSALNQHFTLITDSHTPEEYLSYYRNLGTEVIVVSNPETM
ncbi:DeoR/GlpR family DNA-binding transcription regulator [Marasmitruncus massiliensis]|uniref:DeoR/GlpR family DNA-binding transcription regulator n=1 Tax=Marasmitruncus massiliensis TaxID=1944642 RepID=UPI000C7E2DF6|nr:DeoR/GlpR family DNA-binding transcription regulator [Marasmitruncus massiliensis]